MKLFYDSLGKVIGSVDGATAGIEDSFSMPGGNEIMVDEELANRFRDPLDSIHPHDFMISTVDEVLTIQLASDSTQSETVQDPSKLQTESNSGLPQ